MIAHGSLLIFRLGGFRDASPRQDHLKFTVVFQIPGSYSTECSEAPSSFGLGSVTLMSWFCDHCCCSVRIYLSEAGLTVTSVAT